MRRIIAKFLVWLAFRISQSAREKVIEELVGYEPKVLGSAYQLKKSDLRKYVKEHPEDESYRKGMKGLIEDTKKLIIMDIAKGAEQHGLVKFTVKKGLFEAKVYGKLYVYVPKKDEPEAEDTAGA